MGDAAPALGTEELLAHGDALLRYALTRVADRATAEDLVQETLVTAVGKVSELDGTASVRTWLVGILRNKLLEHYRWKRRHPGDLPTAVAAEGEDDEDRDFDGLGGWRVDPNEGLAGLDPSRAAERSQLRAMLQRCIDHLPKSLHRVYVLRELEELEPADACAAAGISRDSLAVLLYRARQALRVCLQRQGVER
jgi:RNA polymerase sigma-70 factor (ECF subfamily)